MMRASGPPYGTGTVHPWWTDTGNTVPLPDNDSNARTRLATKMTKLLMVEDDDVIREATQLALQRHGYDIRTAADGLDAVDSFTRDEVDVILLDVMLPGLDGISVCRRIRETSSVPIIMLTARSDSVDIVQGLQAGADDYVTKPFDTQVLVARIEAVLRRATPEPNEAGTPLENDQIGDLSIDREALVVRRGEDVLALTPTELKLLLAFADEPGRVLSRQSLLERVWDYAWDGDTRVVDIHIQRLRAKIGTERIETVRGFGYLLRAT